MIFKKKEKGEKQGRKEIKEERGRRNEWGNEAVRAKGRRGATVFFLFFFCFFRVVVFGFLGKGNKTILHQKRHKRDLP